MKEDYEDVSIETSSDTVEQVQEALGASVEIEDTAPDGDEKAASGDKDKTAETSQQSGEPEEAATEGEESEDKQDKQDKQDKEEKDGDEDKPKKKVTPPATVPRSRLNEEIAKRKAAERKLANATREETPDDEPEPEAAKEPQFFSGKARPKLAEFTKGVDEFDSKAMSEATGKFTEAITDWASEEAEAKATYRQEQAELKRAHEALTKDFMQRRDDLFEVMPESRDIILGSNLQISKFMEGFVYESEVGPYLLLHFAEHPKDAGRISELKSRSQSAAMLELETKIKEDLESEQDEKGEEVPEEELVPASRVLPKKAVPPKKTTISKAPPPTARLKTSGPGPKTEAELAGPTDQVGVDLDFNPEYERTVRARQKTS